MREKFEAWLGTETCEVHWDNSAEKNAWYAWQAAYRTGLEDAAKIAEEWLTDSDLSKPARRSVCEAILKEAKS